MIPWTEGSPEIAGRVAERPFCCRLSFSGIFLHQSCKIFQAGRFGFFIDRPSSDLFPFGIYFADPSFQ